MNILTPHNESLTPVSSSVKKPNWGLILGLSILPLALVIVLIISVVFDKPISQASHDIKEQNITAELIKMHYYLADSNDMERIVQVCMDYKSTNIKVVPDTKPWSEPLAATLKCATKYDRITIKLQ